ncbi:CinA family protein [Butyrivibrio sp. WCD2001]|uniref:CinA family protein n=1 Tax=Butyrivibrio sp. WCD2001 TaxID=1280681 RepID=UPI00047D4CC7|nr:CinA family protein [Butyrivibrio sp. WCD2001]
MKELIMQTKENQIRQKYEKITKTLIEKHLTITTMESCTAGMVASLLTDTEGSSAVLRGAFITYSNEAKIMQGVPAEIIEKYGVYSEETARAMAAACRKAYGADFGIGVTGTMGNADPENNDSVPGEVYFAIASEKGPESFSRTLDPEATRKAYKLVVCDMIADELIRELWQTL